MTHLSRTHSLPGLALIAFVGLSIVGATHAQQARSQRSDEEQPVFNEYRGVKIGWLAEDVRKKLGTPANKSDEQDYFIFNEKEMAQILYDKATQKVVTISVDYMNGAQSVPTPQQVFGADFDAKPDGSKYKMVRYTKAGFWLSYNRTTGDAPMVTVTLQKLGQ